MNYRTCLTLASLLGFSAVLLGAIGAHALDDTDYLVRKHGTEARLVSGQELTVAYKYLQNYETGVRYQMWHALALFGVGLMIRRSGRGAATSIASICFLLGTFAFSGSLYIIAILGPRFLDVPWGLVAAGGGILLLLGWTALVIACLQVE